MGTETLPNFYPQLGPYLIQTVPFARGEQLVMRATRPDGCGEVFDVNVQAKSLIDKSLLSSQTACYENELWIRKQLPQHSNILIPRDVFEDESSVFLVQESHDIYVDLLKFVSSQGRLSENIARILFAQLVSAVSFCHQHNVVHRDIKLPAILLDSSCKKVYLSGFRFAEILTNSGQMLANRRGSPAYVSPEMLKSKQYQGQAADIWSLGIVLYVMLCGTYPFVDKDPKKLFDKIMNSKLYLPDHLTAESRHLLSRLLVREPTQRATLTEIALHPWIRVGEDDEQTVPEFLI